MPVRNNDTRDTRLQKTESDKSAEIASAKLSLSTALITRPTAILCSQGGSRAGLVDTSDVIYQEPFQGDVATEKADGH